MCFIFFIFDYYSFQFEEPDELVPTIANLRTCCNNAYSEAEILVMERSVLKELQWKLAVATPIHFLGIFVNVGIVFEDDRVDGQGPTSKIIRYVRKYVDFFAELYLQEYPLQQYLPSIASGAILACSRRAVKMEPIWNSKLTQLYHLKEKDVHECYKYLYDYYLKSFPNVANDAPVKAIEEFDAAAAGLR